ncbi:Ribosome biogenesis protein nsa1 (NOP7-associated protein 1), partial [Linderina pennispora]
PEFSQKLSIKSNGKFITSTQYVGVGAGPDHFVSCTNLGQVRYQSFAGSSTLLKLPVDACRMRTHLKRPSILAVGGREQELTVWDAETLETKKPGEFSKATSAPLFKSKNVANDNLDLRVPVWITDMQFTSDDTSTIAVASGYKHIRLYDTRANQRPVQEWSVSKHPILHLLKSHVKPELFFADNMGNLQQMDMRKGNVIGGYKEIAGAVRAIALSEDGSKIAAAGLDRFVRVYETGGTRAMLHRAYVKQRVTGLVYDWSSKDVNSDEEEQQETEAIWDSMPTAGDKSSKRKRRTSE